ncbi:endonuclease domain-containing protein [Nocardioides panacis]|uniref:Endonuclease domain-containing protein n=1 Tax=Nocardioides panacis TaxID=2849501 RepID=A0A975SV84_9ACTN|nr:endonuclease domain-containing protein [Nocardioides panacis]QWZ06527.1 endonuclease domain-containing protein [Nocardioides panacis]
MRNWDREEVTVVVPKSDSLPVLPGVHFVETRRDIVAMTSPRPGPPHLLLEPALLLFAAYTRSERTAAGVLAAAVQQRLTTPAALDVWLPRMRPLRRSKMFAALLVDLVGGAQSVAEVDVGRLCRRGGLVPPTRQVLRPDRQGRRRYTDCEWALPDGRTVVLEVDGGLHMEAESWWHDMARERELVIAGKVLVRCSTTELRHDPTRIVRDLLALGVPRARPVERGAERTLNRTTRG